MLDYQDFEQTKRELLEAQAEYVRKKDELEAQRDKIAWNVHIFERMYGETNLFNEIKKKDIKEQNIIVNPYYVQPQKNKIPFKMLPLLVLTIFGIYVFIYFFIEFYIRIKLAA